MRNEGEGIWHGSYTTPPIFKISIMKTLALTNKQTIVLLEMVNTLIPEYTWCWQIGDNGIDEHIPMLSFEYDNEGMLTIDTMHWFEVCYTYLAAALAKHYSTTHPSTTKQWAQYMIVQKMSNDIKDHHPVDLLCDIWKNPQNYMQDL